MCWAIMMFSPLLSPLTSLPFPLAATQLPLSPLLAPLRSTPSPLPYSSFLSFLLPPHCPLLITMAPIGARLGLWLLMLFSPPKSFPFCLIFLFFVGYCQISIFGLLVKVAVEIGKSIEKIFVKNFFVFCKIIAKKFVNTLSLCLFFPTFYFKFIVGNL